MPSQLGIFHVSRPLQILHGLHGRNRGDRLNRLNRGDGCVLGTDADALGVGVGDGGVKADVEDGEAGDVVELLSLRDGDVAGDGPHGENVDGVLVEALERKALDVDRVLKVALDGVGGGTRRGGRRAEGRGVGVFRGGGSGEERRFGERGGELGLGDARDGEVDGGGDGGRFEVEYLLLEVDEIFVVSGSHKRSSRTHIFLRRYDADVSVGE